MTNTDTEHGTDGVCPGGKHPKDSRNLCCDACWARIPTRLPNTVKPWRTALRVARSINAGNSVERILDGARDWLVDHPRDAS